MTSSANGFQRFMLPGVLVILLAYSQWGWRTDQSKYQRAIESLKKVNDERSFPVDGSALNSNPLRVIRGRNTLPIAQVVTRHRQIIYFTRPTCKVCQWFTGQMDSILPSWRDSLLVVTSWGAEHGPVDGLTLDSASARQMLGVPALLVADSNGIVRHAVPAGMPAVLRVLAMLGFPAPTDSALFSQRVSDSVASGERNDGAVQASRAKPRP